MTNLDWAAVARRAVEGLGVRPGELVLVREHAGRPDVLAELMLAIEGAGATPLPEIAPLDYVHRLLAAADAAHLASWDRHWSRWIEEVDRILVLAAGGVPEFEKYPEAFAAWSAAQDHLTEKEEARRLPNLVMAAPTEAQANRLGMTLPQLEAAVLPAMALPAETLREEIERVLTIARGASTLTIRSGEDRELYLALGDRTWLADDGAIDEADRAAGSIVSNLPAGSIYTTVLEGESHGTLWLPNAGPAQDVTLSFDGGRIVAIEAASRADELERFFDRHSGEPRRVGHIGIGLNPLVRKPLGWTIVDEHVYGALFISFGENRYMGGQNVSSLNVDYALFGASLLADGRALVEQGRVVGEGAGGRGQGAGTRD